MVRYAGGLIYALSLLLFSSTLASSDFREACVGSDASAVEKMLREGQDPNESGNEPDDPGETPLHLACINGSPSVVKALLSAGAQPNARATGPHSLRMTPLTWCAYGGHDAAVEVLLHGGADANLVVDDEQGNQLTALDIALRVGDDYGGRALRTKEFLLAAGGKKYADL